MKDNRRFEIACRILVAQSLYFTSFPVMMTFVFPPMTLAGANWPEIILQPVQPPTSNPYPPGTTIIGREIILGSVPARVWLEVQVSGWAPDTLREVQAGISATDFEQDGGGYAGASAYCMGLPASGGDLRPAAQPCETDSDCRAIGGPACGLLESSECVNWDGSGYFPSGRFCEPAYYDRCHPRWVGTDVVGTTDIDYDEVDFRFRFTADAGEVPNDFDPSYVGTLVIDIPANAAGTYVIDFLEYSTYFWNGDPVPPEGCDVIPCLEFHVAIISIPCGRCCYGLGGGNAQCVDHVTANECTEYQQGAVFTADEVCPNDGGSPCPACGIDEHCSDGVFCNGPEVCANGECGAGSWPCPVLEECDEATDTCLPPIPTTTVWGMSALTLLLLIASKLMMRGVARDSRVAPARARC